MSSFIIWDVDPRIFSGFEYLRWYGLSWVTGVIVGYNIMIRFYKKESLPVDEIERLVIYVMVGGVIGARLGHILFYDPMHYLANPIEILPIRIKPSFQFTGLAGLASHGGVFGALLGLYLYHRKFKRGYLWLLDRLAIAGAFLGGCIRVGNLMNSEIVGIPSNVPWAFIFTRIDQTPRHPAQLYEALFYFGLGTLLYFIWRIPKYRNATGFLAGLSISMIFSQRFLIEFLKENQVQFEEGLALNMGQMLSIPLAMVGVFLLVNGLRKKPQLSE
ncbi:MAG: prolipoprotein diacylglyceryl transferase [bacterium]|nr:prolipoprotein diacylglyceryl transferase [bacterium]